MDQFMVHVIFYESRLVPVLNKEALSPVKFITLLFVT